MRSALPPEAIVGFWRVLFGDKTDWIEALGRTLRRAAISPSSEPVVHRMAMRFGFVASPMAELVVAWALVSLLSEPPTEAPPREPNDDLARAENLIRSKFLGAQTKQSYEACVQLGIRFLSARMKWQDQPSFGDLVDRWEKTPKALDPIMYWTTLSFGRTIPYRFVLERPGAAQQFAQSVENLVQRSPDYHFSGPRRVLAYFRFKAPGMFGGSKKEALRHALEAQRQAPAFAGNHLAVAEIRLSLGVDAQRAKKDLQRAINLPSSDPEQTRAKAKARTLLEQLEP